MDELAIRQLFKPLWSDVLEEDQFYVKKPLLAHYTSVQVLESIIKNNEIWLSNPLLMNDYEEVKFGILQAEPLVLNSIEISKALQSQERNIIFTRYFKHYYDEFVNEHALDTYILCLSEHDRDDFDGLLSMWRGYGSNGNGVALVFDASKATVVDKSPFIIAQVVYATREKRVSWLQNLISKFAKILNETYIPNEKLYLAAFDLFDRIKVFSIFTKHQGFREEQEWRIVYMLNRDHDNKLEAMRNYWVGPRGIEPKLKLKLEPIEGLISALSLTTFLDRIILGPCISSLFAKATISRMLEKLKKKN
jgi:hypothetical protein